MEAHACEHHCWHRCLITLIKEKELLLGIDLNLRARPFYPVEIMEMRKTCGSKETIIKRPELLKENTNNNTNHSLKKETQKEENQ